MFKTPKHLTAAGLLALLAGTAGAQVQHGDIGVVQLDPGNAPEHIIVTREGGVGAWEILPSANRGDYDMTLNTGRDLSGGVLIPVTVGLTRTEPGTNEGNPYYSFATASPTFGRDSFFLSVFRAGGGASMELNQDAAFGYFPFDAGWMALHAYSGDPAANARVNNGQYDLLYAPPSITLNNDPSTYDLDGPIFTNPVRNGISYLYIPGVDTLRDGVVLVAHAWNEANYAAVGAAAGQAEHFELPAELPFESTVAIVGRDYNGGNENDPVAAVFIPENTPGVIMGSFYPNGAVAFSQGDWTVARTGTGTYRLEIEGENADTGTLIVCPTYGSSSNNDNLVSFVPDGDGWRIESRDQPDLGLQDPGPGVAAHFAFFPDDAEIAGPGTPTREYVESLDDVVSGRVTVTEYNSGNSFGDMRAVVSAGSPLLGMAGENLGDIGPTFVNGLVNDRSGFLIGSTSELFRDNTETGGVSGLGSVGTDNAELRTHSVGRSTGGEMNVNFGFAVFPRESGFEYGQDIGVTDGAIEMPAADGVNPLEDGLLISTNWDNLNRLTTVVPSEAGWTVRSFEGQPDSEVAETSAYYPNGWTAGAPALDSVEVGVIYLPYDAENLVAGRVDADGNVLSGTGGFTIGESTEPYLGRPVWTLTIPGVDARTDGVLLLNAAGEDPINMAWEPDDQGSFRVLGMNVSNNVSSRVPFQFAYIPYEGLALPEEPVCAADRDGDGDKDVQDLLSYLRAFRAKNADMDGDQDTDVQDLLGYLRAFRAGC